MPFPPELDLVVACCRWPPSPARDAAVRDAAQATIDWDFFGKVVARHRVEGLVHDGLRRAGVAVPDEVASVLARAAAGIARRNLVFAAASMRFHRALEAAGVTSLFVKGVTLNMLAYASLVIKHGHDIDIVVEPGGHHAACTVAEGLGFRCISPGPGRSAEELGTWVGRYKHTIWTDKAGVVVELHADLVDNPLLLGGVSVNSPRQPVAISAGISLPTLGGNALYAYLCVHGASHAWSRLKWIADLAALLKDSDAAEIERLHAAAENVGAGRASGQALLLCAHLFDTRLGASLSARLRADRTIQALVRIALASMVRGGAAVELGAQTFGTAPLHLSHFLLQRGWRYKIAELQRKLGSGGAPGGLVQALVRSPLTVSAWLAGRARERRRHIAG